MTRAVAHENEVRRLRIRATAAETALREAELYILELHAQISRANAAAVRLTHRIVVDQSVRRRA